MPVIPEKLADLEPSHARRLVRHERLIDNIAEQMKHLDKFEWQSLMLFSFFFCAQVSKPVLFARNNYIPHRIQLLRQNRGTFEC